MGPWVYHDLAGAEIPGVGAMTATTGALPYDSMRFPSAIGGARPLYGITTADRVVALRYTGSDLIAAGEVLQFDQVAGGNPMAATMTAVTHAPLDVRVTPMAVASRLAMTSPAVTTLTMSCGVYAAPGYIQANASGIQLNVVTVAPTDTLLATPFGNPFESLGWRTLVLFSTARSRSFTVPSLNLPATLYAGLNEYDEPKAGLVLDQAAGLPVLVSINGMPLTSDGASVTIDRTRPVELSLVADRPMNTFYQFVVYELVPNTAAPPNALDLKPVLSANTPNTQVKIPADVFTSGTVYAIRAHAIQGGYPRISEGNLQERSLPFAIGYLDSGVFTVQ
jgi:hypothetical protein